MLHVCHVSSRAFFSPLRFRPILSASILASLLIQLRTLKAAWLKQLLQEYFLQVSFRCPRERVSPNPQWVRTQRVICHADCTSRYCHPARELKRHRPSFAWTFHKLKKA